MPAHLGCSGCPQQLGKLSRYPPTKLASVGVHPGSTPGRRARPRWRKSSTPATAQHEAAYCDTSGTLNLSVPLSQPTWTCRISVCVSLLQASGSLPVTLMNILATLRPPRTNLYILEKEKCRETLAADPYGLVTTGAVDSVPATTQ